MNFLDLTLAPKTNPAEIYRYRDGLYAVDLVIAAIVELDFFTWLNERPSGLAEICSSLGLHERPADVMVTLFAANGWVANDGGVFHVTEQAREHLVKGSQWYLGPYYASLKDRPICQDMLRVLRTGKPANWGSFKKEKEWAKAMEQDDFAGQFTAAMDCRGAYLGQAMARKLDLAGRRHLLDIAGGSGIYACAITACHPHMRATVLEKPPVDQIARKLIAQRGFAERVDVIAGEMFTGSYPADCDVHLLSNVLHDWDVPQVRQLLRQSCAALPSGGMLVIHDAHINAAKDGPLAVAEYSALLMHSTEGKCYSVGEMEGFLGESGFSGFHFTPTAADRSIITAIKE